MYYFAFLFFGFVLVCCSALANSFACDGESKQRRECVCVLGCSFPRMLICPLCCSFDHNLNYLPLKENSFKNFSGFSRDCDTVYWSSVLKHILWTNTKMEKDCYREFLQCPPRSAVEQARSSSTGMMDCGPAKHFFPFYPSPFILMFKYGNLTHYP